MRFILVNSNSATIQAFQQCVREIRPFLPESVSMQLFEGNVKNYLASYVNPQGQRSALVAPANSLSMMGGGFDKAIAEAYCGPNGNYKEFESVIQNHALDKFNGFIPPASANIIDIKGAFTAAGMALHAGPVGSNVAHQVGTLIQVPTMVVPDNIAKFTVFSCMWNVLLATRDKFDTVILPALGAGHGGVSPSDAARLMCGAIGLFFLCVEPMARAAATLLFLGKDYTKFVVPADVAAIEAHLTHEAKLVNSSATDVPLDWPLLMKCLKRCHLRPESS